VDADSSKEADASAAKPAPPKGAWGTILTTTPIVLTILATAFAGLSSSEMTQSMYYRSLAAQHQSKAGDQWGFFQAKKIRGTSLEATVPLLRRLAQDDDFDPSRLDAACAETVAALEKTAEEGGEDDARRREAAQAAAKVKAVRAKLAALLAEPARSDSVPYLTGAPLPKVEEQALENEGARKAIADVIDAVRLRQTEGQTAPLVAKVRPDDIDRAVQVAEENADRLERATEPINETIKQLRVLLAELVAAVKPFRRSDGERGDGGSPLERVAARAGRLNNSFQAAALDFDRRRYGAEASLNLKAAQLYEVRVRRSALDSDRHRERSKMFFYSMLLAQAGVTISSLALAGAKRSWLWLFAALAGVVALAFSAYVYLGY
jgi:hypothetical protein